MIDIRLRPATDADREFLYWLHRTTLKEYIGATWDWDEEYQYRFFDKNFGHQEQQVIEYRGESIGMLRLDPREDCVYLGAIKIVPEFQNQGIGSRLILAFIDEAEQEGLPVELDVLKTNVPARRLYERLGFSIIDEKKTGYIMRTKAPQRTPESDRPSSDH